MKAARDELGLRASPAVALSADPNSSSSAASNAGSAALSALVRWAPHSLLSALRVPVWQPPLLVKIAPDLTQADKEDIAEVILEHCCMLLYLLCLSLLSHPCRAASLLNTTH